MLDETWQKSSASADGGNCLEARWQKASYSGSDGACLEARCSQHGAAAPSVAMRLSTDLPDMSRAPRPFVHPWRVSE